MAEHLTIEQIEKRFAKVVKESMSRERFWQELVLAYTVSGAIFSKGCIERTDHLLAEYDKRFPIEAKKEIDDGQRN